MCEMTARRGFQQQARSSENTKSIETLGGWGPHWVAYTAPQLQALPKLHPALSTSGWGEATEGPPSYCWTGAPQSLATPLSISPRGLFLDKAVDMRKFPEIDLVLEVRVRVWLIVLVEIFACQNVHFYCISVVTLVQLVIVLGWAIYH